MIVFKEFQQCGSKAGLSVTLPETEATLVPCKKNPHINNAHVLTHVVLPLLSDAYDTAKMLCEKYYLASPELKIEEFNSKLFFSHAFDRFLPMICHIAVMKQCLLLPSLFRACGRGLESRFSPVITMFTISLTSK